MITRVTRYKINDLRNFNSTFNFAHLWCLKTLKCNIFGTRSATSLVEQFLIRK